MAGTAPDPDAPSRSSVACVNCRSSKSKCDLSSNNGMPPCRRCRRGLRTCILAESHRGRGVQKKRQSSSPASSQILTLASLNSQAPRSPSPCDGPQTLGLDIATTTGSEPISRQSGPRNHEDIASADLQNLSDALEIPAQVAYEGESLQGTEQGSRDGRKLCYKPVQDGLITPEMVEKLFSTYEKFLHPYFPIIPCETFDKTRLPWLSRYEPHLFSAILTIASKDNEPVHQVCYDHMQQLIPRILAGIGMKIEAVEAMLLLSQWVSYRPQGELAVGRDEEDEVAWMYTGTALRLGCLLGIDRTWIKNDDHEDKAAFNRKRVAWTACYICDQQVSVRLGKGSWSQGPNSLSSLKSEDLPTLQLQSPNEDDWSHIFQANLELTQIFSNVHDTLYSWEGHEWEDSLKERYAEYFRTRIRCWNDDWGTLICSRRLKASLLLTYDYLRLYVNAYAPNAIFIYDAVDAAKSLLSTFSNFVDPETLRYMPLSYYHFIMHSAEFLCKASSTTTMTEQERTNVSGLMTQTIAQLKEASKGANQLGSRYAKHIQLLWRSAQHKMTTSIPLPAGCLKQNYLGPPSLPPGFESNQGNMGNMEFAPGGTSNFLNFSVPSGILQHKTAISVAALDDWAMNTVIANYSHDNPNIISLE